MSYTAKEIATVIAPPFKPLWPEQIIEHLLTDSRRVVHAATTIFFALPGGAKTSLQFIPLLYAAGVRNFVVSEQPTGAFEGTNFFVVADVLAALQTLAAHHRQKFTMPVIGITGSNGKTIVKEWLYLLLEPDFVIVRSPKSYNSQIGVPLSLWQLSAHHTLAIIEAGISQPGEMERLNKMIKPTIGVLTNIGAAHDEGFQSHQQKGKEKWKLFSGANVVISPKKWAEKDRTTQAIFTWGSDDGCTMQVKKTELKNGQAHLSIQYKNQSLLFVCPFTDEASIQNCLTCISVLLYLNIDAKVIKSRLQSLHSVDMRLQLKAGVNQSIIINDSYSADLTSLNSALHFLAQQHGAKRRVVILSDFAESGKKGEELYALVADALIKNNVQEIVAIGDVITTYLPSFLPPNIGFKAYKNTEEAIQLFRTSMFAGATVLIKGARTFGFERIALLLETKVHQTVLEINLAALAHNLKQYQKKLAPGTKVMAMVKAFSYGSGSAEIASALQFNNVDFLGVAYADEGIELRKAGISLPIMVLNTDEASFPSLVEYSLQPVLFSVTLFKQFVQYLKTQGLSSFPVHIEIETGMNRLGFLPAQIPELVSSLAMAPVLKVESVFSHLAASEDKDEDEFTKRQAHLFTTAAAQLQATLPYPFLKHLANSAAIVRHPHLSFDMVRLGIGLYGIELATDALQLQPVASLRSTIAQIKPIKKGESISYNRRTVLEKDSVIATVRIGYADGYPRSLGNGRGAMLVAGVRAPVVGSVCMDMTMIDITGIKGVEEGDEVEVFGAGLTVQEVAKWAGTIPYEIMTSVSQRVKRVYFQE